MSLKLEDEMMLDFYKQIKRCLLFEYCVMDEWTIQKCAVRGKDQFYSVHDGDQMNVI